MLLLCEGDSPFKMIHLLWIIWLMLLTWKKAYSLFTQTIFKTYWIFISYDVKTRPKPFFMSFFLFDKKEFSLFLLHVVSAKSLQNVDYFTFQVPQYFIFLFLRTIFGMNTNFVLCLQRIYQWWKQLITISMNQRTWIVCLINTYSKKKHKYDVFHCR